MQGISAGSLIKLSKIFDNAAVNNGGGIYYYGYDLTIEEDVVVSGNTADVEDDGISCIRNAKPSLPTGGFTDEIGTNCL